MKNCVSVFLSILIGLQSLNISVADILSLDDLIDHAVLHKKEFGDSFFQFIVKHYGDERLAHEQQSNHQNSHEKLPFQNNITLSIVFTILPTNDLVLLDKNQSQEQSSPSFFYISPSGDLYISGIFQPPRTV